MYIYSNIVEPILIGNPDKLYTANEVREICRLQEETNRALYNMAMKIQEDSTKDE